MDLHLGGTAGSWLAGACSAVLVMEFALHGTAMLTRMEAGIEPLTKHFGARPGPLPVLALGALDLAAAAAITAGFWRPALGAAGGAYGVLFFGTMLGLRFHRRLGGILPPDFPLFFTLAVLLVITRTAQ